MNTSTLVESAEADSRWRSRWARSTMRLTIAAAWFVCSPVATRAQAENNAARCEQGVISSIEVDSQSIFDPESTQARALRWAYRTANLLHVRTSASFIRGELLFSEGDCFDPFLASESQRLLDQYDFLSQVQVTATPDEAGGQRIAVTTRDEWSTKVDLGLTYDEGLNLEKLQVTEQNFLGRGIFGEFTHLERRETRTQSFSVATPRFFGRSNASLSLGRSRAGRVFSQYLRYPFVGEAGSVSLREGYSRATDFFLYSTEGAESFSRILVPKFMEQLELSFGRRLGEPGSSVIVGLAATRDVVRFRDQPEVTFGDDFNDRVPLEGPLAQPVIRQLRESAATRLGVHIGLRRYQYREYEGLDGVRDRQTVGLGLFAGVSLARSLKLLIPDDVPRLDDTVMRGHVSSTLGAGSSLMHGTATLEARHESAGWRDILLDADLVFYGRNDGLDNHTLFVRTSYAGGWNTTLPYQLTLGGREGVRSLLEDQLPGGKLLLFVLEDRIKLGWPGPGVADLGVTLFGDLGRVWRGDAPYGVNSDWQAAVGFGLRLGLPSGTRQILRTDLVFPVDSGLSSPVFRVTLELNKLRAGFFTREAFRSRRFNLGPESF